MFRPSIEPFRVNSENLKKIDMKTDKLPRHGNFWAWNFLFFKKFRIFAKCSWNFVKNLKFCYKDETNFFSIEDQIILTLERNFYFFVLYCWSTDLEILQVLKKLSTWKILSWRCLMFPCVTKNVFNGPTPASFSFVSFIFVFSYKHDNS